MSARPIILVHGLWMSRHTMLWLAHWFRRRGYPAFARGYRSIFASLDDNAADLARQIARLTTEPIDVVCHSYGGLVTLRMLALGSSPRVERVVLLGSPIGGSSAARRLAARPLGHLLLGRTRGLWVKSSPVTIPGGIEVGSIAGSRPIGFGRVVSSIDGPSDGVVALEETRLEGLADHLTLDCAHAAMLFSSKVARQAEHFLAHGRFAR